jgi:hypothetical protein
VAVMPLPLSRFRQARWRTWLRVHTPRVLYYHLDLVMSKVRDCGDHDWYNAGADREACYHCRMERRRGPAALH